MEFSSENTSMGPPVSVECPRSARDWEGYQEIFVQLYSGEGKTLSEVVGIMETEHGFRAVHLYRFSLALQAHLDQSSLGVPTEDAIDVVSGHASTKEKSANGAWTKVSRTARCRM